MEIKAYEEAVSRLQNENMKQIERFDALQARSLETNVSKVIEMTELFER